ncbi:hypothetical protein BCR34DRAFT_582484 [Clohesyomyces aquaticus]|uniref:Uncharacterized protein n=1 Tax=Clohesyomyces aquaticus TaxID=1231657 RepID=A0A1Y2A9U4_9PLEO|nr:hypothetical protein BCR34DRAFT_582484 [Clohesyomyces aquaticus]
MPRQNRYHPYTRRNEIGPKHPVFSPRFSPPASRLPNTLPPINEQRNATLLKPKPCQYNSTSYHAVNPNYIRGITGDGKKLVARSIMQSPDGIFHIQMQVVDFPGIQAPGNPPARQHLPPFTFPGYESGNTVREQVTTRDMNGFKVEEVRLVQTCARERSHDSRSEGSYGEGEALLDGEPGNVVFDGRHGV